MIKKVHVQWGGSVQILVLAAENNTDGASNTAAIVTTLNNGVNGNVKMTH